MKRKFLLTVSLIVGMALAACGPKPAPDLNATDVQNTAVANAMTGIAMTQAVLPTNTAIPTNSPIPTIQVVTMAALPTSALPTAALGTPIVAPVNNSNASPTPDCYQPAPLPKDLLGTKVQIRLVNKSDGPVNLSMGMYEPNEQGECFTFAFSVGHKSSEEITVLSGCYWIAGYQNGPKPSTPRVDYICLTDTNETRGLTINNNTIGFD